MNSLTKRLMAGVAAAATLLSGMALAGSAMADTAIPTANLEANQTLTVNGSEGDLTGKTLYAIRLASYSAAQVDEQDNITGYDVADAGLATTVDTALKSANIIGTNGKPTASGAKGTYDSSNPMQWVVQNLLDSGSSPYSGQLRNFLTKFAAQDLSTYTVDGNKMDVAENGNSVTKDVSAGIYVIIDKAADSGSKVVSMPMMVGTGIKKDENSSYTTLKKDASTSIQLGSVEYKATKPTVGKKIVKTGTPGENEKCSNGGSNEKCVDANTAAIGDTVTYELTTTVPNYTGYNNGYYLALNDTLSKGLTFGQITSVKVEGVDTEYKDNATFYAKTDLSDVSSADIYNGGKSFSILFAPTAGTDGKQTSDITKQADLFPVGKRITVQYTATLNANAVIGQDNNQAGNPNKVNLTYSRNPNGEEHGDSDNVEVKTYTGNLKLHKVNAKGNAVSGAKFEIRSSENGEALKVSGSKGAYTLDSSGSSTELVVPESGILTINGLNGTYYIKETSSPFGATALPSFKTTVTVFDKDENGNKAGTQTVRLDNWSNVNNMVTVDNDAAKDADLKVLNVHNFTEMPKTGATWLCIYAAMAVLCGGGAFLLLRSSKKRA